ncbi:ParB/RepB/Spo0J family partition protein [Sphingomonas crusticola]|uniref:ParB/RepB/Spo0J family partition protein n=1 Tax=Sphingomonas crusticola TaxID=1697973 RepID=UPI000E2213F1|nr:ParB/RepB/Spo0J family partition protein [Sphingomonas crusticola]
MKLEYIPLDKLEVSRLNMRDGKRPPDVSDLVPTVRTRGILQCLIVRPVADRELFEIVAGRRRFHAAQAVAAETATAMEVPCAILDGGDDADALEASLIENIARLDPDEVSRWETFTRLVKQGRRPDEIGLTFGLPERAVRQVLALGNLLPRIRQLYARGELDMVGVRHLTMASKRQQQDWLAQWDDPDRYAPTGHGLKAWLFGGQSIPAAHAVFDIAASGLATVADLFGEDRYFSDVAGFWEHQNAAIATKREAYLAQGWGEVVIVPPTEHFSSYDHEKRAKRKGGRVYLDVRANGEVIAHEGYVSRRAAEREAKAAASKDAAKPTRGELSGPLASYVDLHRHAAARAELLDHPEIALRLIVAHIVAGSPLVSVRPDPQCARDEATKSLHDSRAEARFAERRRQALKTLGLDPDDPTLLRHRREPHGLVGLFLRLLDMTDADVLALLAVCMGEALAVGSVAVEAVGLTLGVDMAHYWHADDAFFALNRDKELLHALVAEVAGSKVAKANSQEKARTLKTILRNHLDGTDGRPKVAHWVPKWMGFPPVAYTKRGGVGMVSAHAQLAAAKAAAVDAAPAPEMPGASGAQAAAAQAAGSALARDGAEIGHAGGPVALPVAAQPGSDIPLAA